ncbi:ATP-binding cassette domain-containing protein [Paenibacillus sp. GSMTC-2017]|uniref:ATP-binding cassette domain-containing protein n=1 Tax=Paenibacillus sp. GSMTC-2017 TaxID=2794350 RepID=UPI0018D86097|nr:ATP-binding cassette domain-containing protein [Paenibacillus sp. GSMTC-2017]MBH5316460.1 ATP-binding cassette domain-containing protein [Paenibacillus sp. GSMTC-2017]
MRADNVAYKYKGSKRMLFEEVSFQLNPNIINVLVGQNGAGKKTLFDYISGIISPLSGTLKFPETAQILYLTQSIFYSNDITAKDFVKFIRRISGVMVSNDPFDYLSSHNARNKELINRLWNLKIGKMSIGERKWLFVNALTQVEHSLYLLDEPTSGVDPVSRKQIYRSIQGLVEQKKTVVVSTHQLNELINVDCHMILLHKGRIAFEGDIHTWMKQYNTTDPNQAFELATESVS